MASAAAVLFVAIVALLFASAAARPGLPFHPCNTLFVTYTISATASSSSSGTDRTYRFVSMYRRIITPFSSSSSAYAFDDHRPLLIRRSHLPRREPAALGFSSLQERAKDILVVIAGLLFGVGCGALTAAAMYLVWSIVSNLYGFDEEEEDYVSESPKKAGYVKIPAAEPAPAKEGYEAK